MFLFVRLRASDTAHVHAASFIVVSLVDDGTNPDGSIIYNTADTRWQTFFIS